MTEKEFAWFSSPWEWKEEIIERNNEILRLRYAQPTVNFGKNKIY